MNSRFAVSLALAFLLSSGCSDSDPCAKLTKDVCGKDDKACSAWVETDLLEGAKNKETCNFLIDDGNYKDWIEMAQSSYADSKD